MVKGVKYVYIPIIIILVLWWCLCYLSGSKSRYNIYPAVTKSVEFTFSHQTSFLNWFHIIAQVINCTLSTSPQTPLISSQSSLPLPTSSVHHCHQHRHFPQAVSARISSLFHISFLGKEKKLNAFNLVVAEVAGSDTVTIGIFQEDGLKTNQEDWRRGPAWLCTFSYLGNRDHLLNLSPKVNLLTQTSIIFPHFYELIYFLATSRRLLHFLLTQHRNGRIL